MVRKLLLCWLLGMSTIFAQESEEAFAEAPAQTVEQEAEYAPSSSVPTLNPDISVIVDFLVQSRKSGDGGDQGHEHEHGGEGGRFSLREVEIALQHDVDPFHRADVFVGVHEDEVEIEEAYATALALPHGLQGRLGIFAPRFSKVNLTHRPEIETVDYPLMIRHFFGDEGWREPGLEISGLGAFFGEGATEWSYALTAGKNEQSFHGGKSTKPTHILSLRHFWETGEASLFDLGLSFAGGVFARKEELDEQGNVVEPEDHGDARLWNAYLLWRYKRPEASLYNSLLFRAEWLSSRRISDVTGTRLSSDGYYLFVQKQLGWGKYAAVRFDQSAAPTEARRDKVLALLLTYFPSEFSRYRLEVQREDPHEGRSRWNVLLQATFSLGVHRPHAL